MRYPSYLNLHPTTLAERARQAVATLGECRICPRDCSVNRLQNRWAACKTWRHAVVSSWFPHFGEEDCLRGWNGSGTIFFGHCNLRCVFCQNYDISQAIKPGPAAEGSTPEEIAEMMAALERAGCHNINFVTPEHVAPQVVEAIAVAVPRGLRVPIVYNTSAYDSLESLVVGRHRRHLHARLQVLVRTAQQDVYAGLPTTPTPRGRRSRRWSARSANSSWTRAASRGAAS